MPKEAPPRSEGSEWREIGSDSSLCRKIIFVLTSRRGFSRGRPLLLAGQEQRESNESSIQAPGAARGLTSILSGALAWDNAENTPESRLEGRRGTEERRRRRTRGRNRDERRAGPADAQTRQSDVSLPFASLYRHDAEERGEHATLLLQFREKSEEGGGLSDGGLMDTREDVSPPGTPTSPQLDSCSLREESQSD